MPALTLAAYQWMDKTHHRPLLPRFDKFGRFVARIMLPMALVLDVYKRQVLLALPDADLADAAAESARTRTELGLYERPEEAGEGEE